MFEYVIWLLLSYATLLKAGLAIPQHSRLLPCSISPCSIHATLQNTLLSEDDIQDLRQSNLRKHFKWSNNPLWKWYKYRGIDMKPLDIQTKTAGMPQAEQGGLHRASTSNDAESTALKKDAYLNFLSKPKHSSFSTDLDHFLYDTNADELRKIMDEIVRAIEKERKNDFFKLLWWLLFGAGQSGETEKELINSDNLGLFSSLSDFDENSSEASHPENTQSMYMPETKGPHVSIEMPDNQLTIEDRDTPQLQSNSIPEFPANRGSKFSIAAPEEALLIPESQLEEQDQQVNTDNSCYSCSKQPWIPSDSYGTHVGNSPSSHPSPSGDILSFPQDFDPSSTIIPPTHSSVITEINEAINGHPSKISEDEFEGAGDFATEVAQGERVETSLHRNDEQIKAKNIADSVGNVLSKFNLPKDLTEKLQSSRRKVEAKLV